VCGRLKLVVRLLVWLQALFASLFSKLVLCACHVRLGGQPFMWLQPPTFHLLQLIVKALCGELYFFIFIFLFCCFFMVSKLGLSCFHGSLGWIFFYRIVLLAEMLEDVLHGASPTTFGFCNNVIIKCQEQIKNFRLIVAFALHYMSFDCWVHFHVAI
jgi:hypothetical protein